MFHWICPECGQEIAPGVKECPVCEPGSENRASASPLPSSGSIVTAPETVEPASVEPAAKVEQPLPEPQIVLQPEVVALQPDLIVLQAEVVEQPEPRPSVASSMAEPETFADRLADLAERLHGERIPYTAPRVIPSTPSTAPRAYVEPGTAQAYVILDVTPATPLLAPPRSMLLLAEPQPPSVATEIPTEQVFHPRPAEHTARSHSSLGAEPSGLPVDPGPVLLPGCPERVPKPAFAPFQDYYKAADRLMGPAAYATKAAASAVGAEPKVTLPGPALPRELMSLQAAGLVPIGRTRRGGALPNRYGWTTRLVVLGILLTAGLAATYRVMPGTSANVPVKPQESAPEQPVAPRPDNSHSLARFVEVTGIRFMELNKKPQIHYLVVNHSSAPLNSITVYVTLRTSSSKPGQPPLSRFAFRSPALAAFEAKEMASPIERISGPLELPDWQDLHADVEVQ